VAISLADDRLQVYVTGHVSPDEVDYVRAKAASVARYADEPILLLRLRLTKLKDSGGESLAIVQANLDLNGRLIRAQVARPTMREAADEAHDRLRDRVQRVGDNRQTARHGRRARAFLDSDRRGTPASQLPMTGLPVDERTAVRHKAIALGRQTVDQAADHMAAADYQFHVFVEEGSGICSVLYRDANGTAYRLDQLDPAPDKVILGETPVTISTEPAPTVSLEAGVDRLNLSGLPFVFFCDTDSLRGCVLYHRYDGHYGAIETT
jgi:ribosome-associated translation inhibitor RaiA